MPYTIRINGQDCPVTNIFDIDGDELEPDAPMDQICRIVCPLPDGRWLACEVDTFDLRVLS